jgi:hypothetical protein
MTTKEMILIVEGLTKVKSKEKRELALEDLLNYCDSSEVATIELAMNARLLIKNVFRF